MAGGRPAGLVVAGGRTPLEALGMPGDAGLAPIAGRRRIVDVALATLHNSGIRDTQLVVTGGLDAADSYRRHLQCWSDLHRSHAITATVRDTPLAPLARIRAAARAAVHLERATAVIALLADDLLQIDLRPVLAAHHASAAELTLLCVPARERRSGNATLVGATDAGCVVSLATSDPEMVALAWTGGVIAHPAILRRLAAGRTGPSGELGWLRGLVAERRVRAHDVLTPYDGARCRPYWHPTATLEDYYDAQMDLCTPTPALDLWSGDWPLPGIVTTLPPAKVVADAGGHSGQALNALLADGALVRGGAVIRSVLGHGVLVDAGAEVEDAVLFDGCVVGRGATVRRAVVGPGVVIGDGRRIGYDESAPGEDVLPSGLTLVASPATAARAVAGALS